MIQPWLVLIGQLAWPVAAIVMMIVIIRQINGGIIGRMIPEHGSLRYGDFTITRVSRGIIEGQEAIQEADVPIQTPIYARASPEPDADELTPYETIMTAYSSLASAVAELADKHGGYNDQRYVWHNIDILLKRNVIDHALFGAIRASQQVRNSIRRLGEKGVTPDQAKAFAETAYSAEQALRQLT